MIQIPLYALAALIVIAVIFGGVLGFAGGVLAFSKRLGQWTR